MSTQDVPGANPANKDQLAAGCWAEHEDGSLLYVKGTEDNQVVYELHDVAQEPAVYYNDAMREEEFKKFFSFPPIGTSDVEWKWHDKTPFPWKRVMKTFGKPRPQIADVQEELKAAARVAKSLGLRARNITEAELGGRTEQVRDKTRTIWERFQEAFDVFVR